MTPYSHTVGKWCTAVGSMAYFADTGGCTIVEE